jgi:hypothetical protein
MVRYLISPEFLIIYAYMWYTSEKYVVFMKCWVGGGGGIRDKPYIIVEIESHWKQGLLSVMLPKFLISATVSLLAIIPFLWAKLFQERFTCVLSVDSHKFNLYKKFHFSGCILNFYTFMDF